jgi:glutamate dehydrogenase
LCPAELLRLFKEELPLAAFDPELLSDDGKLYVCDPAKNVSAAAAEEALRARNTMHNRVIADAFIPAGGRPATMHIDNWKQFLRPDNGKPSSKLIVEGANLFLTPAARAAMHAETGIPIVKDSSANKCGVICSSFEIMSSMLLSDQEFANVKTVLERTSHLLKHLRSCDKHHKLTHDVISLLHPDLLSSLFQELVEDVLVRLRLLAKREAELLFREFRSLPGSLPDFSQRISLAINRVTDAIADDLDEHTGGDYDSMMHLVKSHMPEKLTEIAGASLNERVPKEYLKRAIASTLASHVVYREGVQFVEQHREGHLGALAFDYLEAEKQVSKVLETLDQAWENGGKDGLLDEEVATTARQIVEDGGVRAYMGRHSGGFGGIEK